MSQPAEHLMSLFTGLEAVETTNAPTKVDLGIDELDRWTTSDMAAVSSCKVCWAPRPATLDALPRLAQVA